MSTCLMFVILAFCEPNNTFLVNDHVDNAVGLYFREYVFNGKQIVTVYQLSPVDLSDDRIDTLPIPLFMTIERKPYAVSCRRSTCELKAY